MSVLGHLEPKGVFNFFEENDELIEPSIWYYSVTG